jgi:hypothetical protein
MIAIQTKYFPASNIKGSRIKAFTETGLSATVSYDHVYSHEMVHFQAVKALIKKHKLDWNINDMRYGGIKNGYVFCFANSIVKE